MAIALTTLAIALAVGSTAAKVVGDVKAGNAARRAGEAEGEAQRAAGQASLRSAESQAGLADYNASVAELQAKDATARGLEEESRFRSSVQGIIGSTRADAAAQNVDVNFGSAVDVQADAAFLGELDALTIRTNAAREAWGFQVQAEDLRRRGVITRQEGANAAEAGEYYRSASIESGRASQSASRWGAAGTLLGGGSSLLQARYGFGGR